MCAKIKQSVARLIRLGGPEAGTVAALALGPAPGDPVFAGTAVGLYRSVGEGSTAIQRWERLAQAPVGIIALAVSPNYASDRSLLVGTGAGIYCSHDGGESWTAAALPIAGASAIAFSFSPSYAQDGSVLAGTLEDGVFFSNDRGASWHSRSFGVLDATIYSVAVSPDFTQDETAVAGADSTLYLSYNGARAWKELPLPESAAPALSVAMSPRFQTDGTLFAGTEAQGLYRSTDRGQRWQRLDLPATSINALAWVAGRAALLAATDAGLFLSEDHGESWHCLLDEANVISLAARADLVVVGVVDRGACLSADLDKWQRAPSLSARPLVGLALSPEFEQDGVAFAFGPSEMLWRSTDGGHNWAVTDEAAPAQDLHALVVSPDFARDRSLAAASPMGVLVSRDAGEHWHITAGDAANLLAVAPNGRLLAAGFIRGEVRASEDWGQTWQPVSGPWSSGAALAALAVGHNRQFYVAVLEGAGPSLNIWHGTTGQFEKVLSQPAGSSPLVTLYVPAEPAADRPWYAGLGNQVWKFSARRGRPPAVSTVFDQDEAGHSLLALTGLPGSAGTRLLASNGRQLFTSVEAQTWTLAADFGHDRAVALVVSPNYHRDKTVYVLLLGGTFGRILTR